MYPKAILLALLSLSLTVSAHGKGSSKASASAALADTCAVRIFFFERSRRVHWTDN